MPTNRVIARFNIVTRAIKYTLANQEGKGKPTLDEIAAALNVSTCRLKRVFKEWGRLSPEQFFEFLSKSHTRMLLRKSLATAKQYSSDFSMPKHCADLPLRLDSLSDEAFYRIGERQAIYWGKAVCAYGYCVLVWTSRGLVKMAFVSVNDSLATFEQTQLKTVWPHADFQQDDRGAQQLSDRIFGDVDASIGTSAVQPDLTVLLRGSDFQRQVWEALIRIPAGYVYSYKVVAKSIGKPTAIRAVASAIAKNEHAYLIPCHRVISNSGDVNNYRWGTTKKIALLMRESTWRPT